MLKAIRNTARIYDKASNALKVVSFTLKPRFNFQHRNSIL